ncbi:MAG: hypothetical protein E7546_00650 [Ruminococcaceae bacterium]|nr:hypothetical protein [Oscillospiraceae bacterium]
MKKFISVILVILTLSCMAFTAYAAPAEDVSDNAVVEDAVLYTADEDSDEEEAVSESSASGNAVAEKSEVMKTVDIMAKGMLGIFVVMIMIYIVIAILGKVTGGKKKAE